MPTSAIAYAKSLAPLIREAREDTENDRRVSQPIIEALKAGNLHRMMVPETHGGLALPVVETTRVLGALARAEPAVSWVVWNNALPALFGRFLPDNVRADLFDDPTWMYANSTRPSGTAEATDEGFEVSGRWSLVSGCDHAEWFALMCMAQQNGEPLLLDPGIPDRRIAFVHRSDVEIIDTWHVGGLRGTGSHDVVVRECAVPLERAVSPMGPPTLDEPLARMPILSTMAGGFTAQMLGLAKESIATVIEIGRTKLSPDPSPDMRERANVQVSVAKHGAAVAAAEAHLEACLESLWSGLLQGPPELEQIQAVWNAAYFGNSVGQRAIESMYDTAGTTAIYEDCFLERAHRDARVMRQHVIAQSYWLEDSGRIAMGLDPANPQYTF